MYMTFEVMKHNLQLRIDNVGEAVEFPLRRLAEQLNTVLEDMAQQLTTTCTFTMSSDVLVVDDYGGGQWGVTLNLAQLETPFTFQVARHSYMAIFGFLALLNTSIETLIYSQVDTP